MAKVNTTLDEELYDGIQQARKKKPRYFAMITKGADVVGLIVQKKKILEGAVQSAKKEFKGNQVIQGVCQGEGVELTFEVLEEQNIKPLKIKEFIDEQTELTIKPQWLVVKALSEVKENEDEIAGAPAAGAPTAPTAPTAGAPTAPPETPAGDALAELAAKMKQLKPAVQVAIVANPTRKDDLLGPVAAFKKQIEAKDEAGARQSLMDVVKLIKELTSTGATPPPPTSAQQAGTEDAAYPKAKAKFAAARGTWIKVKDQAVANIHAIRDAMVAEYKDAAEVKENLARGVKELDEVAAKFNEELKLKFDAFTADPPPPPDAREGIKRETLALIGAYRQEIEGNSIYEDLDQREFAQVLVKAPLLKALAGMAKDLA